MRILFILICALLSFASYGQTANLLLIDPGSLTPVQTDEISGVAITKISQDPSRRPCARLKMHINRLTPEEIQKVTVRTLGGNVVVTKCIAASEGNGLIIELTAKETTRFCLFHEKYGESNEVNLNLEGNKEYRINAMLNTTHSVVVSSNVIDAEVYVDDAYKGNIESTYTLTVKGIYPGYHKLKVAYGSISEEIDIDVNSSNVYFKVDLNQALADPQYVFFQISPKNAKLLIDNRPYFLNAYGELQDALMLNNGSYNYSVSADGYHSEAGTFVINGTKVEKYINLKPAHGFLKVPGEGVLDGAGVYIDDKYIGDAPITSGAIPSGTHTVRIVKQLYAESISQVEIKDGETLVHKPQLSSDFATVTVQSTSGAEIYVNGQKKGNSPWTGNLRSGVYTFQARMPGHSPASISATISPNPTVQLHTIPAPTPIMGTVNLQSSPSADVYIDNKLVGRTPLSTKVILGDHTVSFRKDNFKTVNKVIRIKEGMPSTIKVTLEEGRGILQSNMTTGQPSNTKSEPANCYIISKSGEYSFPTVKGNSSESVGKVASASVLWESYGTATTPKVGALIKSVSYKGGHITFRTADTFRKGNAVIAAKDADGKILWSWHIWMTDQPNEYAYGDKEFIMMDRNLGATNASAGTVGSLGLLYQWGRKDPFLGASSISSSVVAKSTIKWPEAKDVNFDEIEYSIKNPTTFVKNTATYYKGKVDWCSGSNIQGPRWQANKTIYDPCPPGWKVPEGSIQEALTPEKGEVAFDNNKKGKHIKSDDGKSTWFPAAGLIHYEYGSFGACGSSGLIWTSTPNRDGYIYDTNERRYVVFVGKDNDYSWMHGSSRASGYSVRCMKETTLNPLEAIDLSYEGPANCYIVSEKGTYKFPTVKGNSRISVGNVKSVSVLWESFGTGQKPEKGALIKKVLLEDNYIVFKTSSKFKEGNAVIAAKDEQENILWSWHIWMTSHPKENNQNSTEVMMDRYLGAVITTDKGSEEPMGLIYQWGRKDPFLSRVSLSSHERMESTGSWDVIKSDKDQIMTRETMDMTGFRTTTRSLVKGTGSIEYSIAHPTTFISNNSINSDWWYHYTDSRDSDNTRWQLFKTAYDPCPPGWKVSQKDVNRSKRERVNGSIVRCVKETETNPYSDMANLSAADAKDLSSSGSANCYIVSESGLYKFKAVKGNSQISVGNVAHCTLLWETFGIERAPKMGELIEAVSYRDGYIIFKAAHEFRNGNALIAALDDKGELLWSWHIWLTPQPKEHTYNNNAGTMMDRNLGAISEVPGQSGSGGLFYLWGNKDPLFGTTHLEQRATAASPTTISYTDSNWQKEKTVYDPCPVGWRVQEAEVWAKAAKKGVPFKSGFDKKNIGKNLGGKLGLDKTIWYPVDGFLGTNGYHNRYSKGCSWSYSCYWSCTSEDQGAYVLHIGEKSEVRVNKDEKAHGFYVRCVKQ